MGRKAPVVQTAKRDSVMQAAAASKAEADSLGAQHMAVAANKARARLAAGQDAAVADDGFKRLLNNINPFAKIAKVLGGK